MIFFPLSNNSKIMIIYKLGYYSDQQFFYFFFPISFFHFHLKG